MLKQALNKTIELSKTLYFDFKEFLAPSVCLACDINDPTIENLLCAECVENLQKELSGAGPVCPFCGRPSGAKGGCNHCRTELSLPMFYCGAYDGLLKKTIIESKFHNRFDLCEFITRLVIKPSIEPLKSEEFDYIVPVPLHKDRLKERNYNQSLLIARVISELVNVEIADDILIRVKPSIPQSKIHNYQARWDNVKNAFELNEYATDEIKENSKILLVDDIITTGATVFEASSPLTELKPSRVFAFALAFTEGDPCVKV